MNGPKIESKKEMYYLKYKKSSIFNSLSDINDIKNDSKITDKITNGRYDKIFEPKMNNLTSRQRYIQNLYKNDYTDIKISLKKHHSKIVRNKSRSNSEVDFEKSNLLFNPLTDNKKNLKRSMTFYKDNSNNNNKIRVIKRAKNNNKVSSNYSRNFDYINNTTSEINKESSIISNKKKNINEVNKKVDIVNNNKTKLIKKDIHKKKNNKNYLENEFKFKNNYIKSEREKEELLRKKVKEKAFNRKNNIKEENIKNELLPPMYIFKQNIKNKKTNISNLESVNYNILNNKKSNIRKAYTDLSSIKPSFEKVTDYEIKMPKNYNKINDVTIKNILHSEGLHSFKFSEEGDIIGGTKGKFKFEIRNSNNDKFFDLKIKRINSKFKKLDVKLNKTERKHSKKKSELFHDIPKIDKTTKTTKTSKNKKK